MNNLKMLKAGKQTIGRQLRFFVCPLGVFKLLVLSAFLGAAGDAFAQPSISEHKQKGQYFNLHNPILKGFYPDPSIIRVERADTADYYLINSSFSYFPGIPVFHSTDMAHWKQIGNVISRPRQMNFLGARITRGLFAPSISYHKGLFYVVCTQVDTGGNFVVIAKDPAGPWSDPVFLPKVLGIDPALFFDKKTDKAYIVYNGDPEGKPLYSGHRAIRMYEFDYKNLQILGDSKVLINGGVHIAQKPEWIEGPHLMQRKGWYYLYAAEGGTGVNHSEVVFRSRQVTGPFTAYKDNPILTQRTLPAERLNPITSTGHAQLVKGPDGKTYAFFLGVRPYDQDYYNTGRETFVAPVIWKEGWPVVNTGKEAVLYAYPVHYPLSDTASGNHIPLNRNFIWSDKFDGPLDLSYLFLRTIDSSNFKTMSDKGTGLLLKLKPETIMEYGNPAFIGRRQQNIFGSYEANFVFSTNKPNEKAGIVLLQNETHFYYACASISQKTRMPVIQLFQADSSGMKMELLAEKTLPVLRKTGKEANEKNKTISIKLLMQGANYSFYYHASGTDEWQVLKTSVDARPLSTHVAGGFTGCIIGLYATSLGEPSSNHVLYKTTQYIVADKTD